MRTIKHCLGALGLALGLGALTAHPPAAAQDRAPIRIIVGAAPGGTTDTLAREISIGMGMILKRSVVVENRPGAAGNIAADLVAKSAPDGNTLLMSFTSHTINASLFKSLPFDPIKDFTPITMVGTSPGILVAAQHVPANNVSELLALAKANPGQINIALASIGASTHLAGERLKMMTGVQFTNVPYKGTSQAMNDLVAGHVDLLFANPFAVMPHVGSNKVKLLGVTSATPMKQLPDVPPIADTVPGFESDAWFGLFGPKNMPPDVTQRLYEAARQAINNPDFVRKLAADGGTPGDMTPEAFAAFLSKDITRWAEVVKFTGAAID